ncbi:MAG: peptide chain release factor N(5)-glutamine methyltransferase [Candidatus Omnitrophica bacterium]|nr:peptide chain release factor N(5)-glutamine methyltransferase [Candidatus Omnitrophota bacterium]
MALLESAEATLEEAGVSRPRWTAEQLLAHRLNCRPIDLYLEPSVAVIATAFLADAAARANGVPLQYLLGSAEFYGREFEVGPGVFIPRPETEVLIDVSLERLSARGPAQSVVVDVGTGCGTIAITLALERPGTRVVAAARGGRTTCKLRVVATDRSAHALGFARRNADRHQVSISFLEGDLLDPVAGQQADLIAANLPYLDSEKSSEWPRELHWEPWLALDGGERGLSLVERLIRQAAVALNPGGNLVLEIGDGQAASVVESAESNGFQRHQVIRDLAGMERVIILSRSTLT